MTSTKRSLHRANQHSRPGRRIFSSLPGLFGALRIVGSGIVLMGLYGQTFLSGSEPAPVSRAEYEALRQEFEALRLELQSLRGELGAPASAGEIVLAEEGQSVERGESIEPPERSPDTPTLNWNRGLSITHPENTFSLSLSGVAQPRYEYVSGASDRSSLSLRRLRLNVTGHAYIADLTFRVATEFRRDVSLRDGWINYRFSDSFQVRAGQVLVPFSWDGDSSFTRHQFMEFSIANQEFDWSGTLRDIGVMVHGRPFGRMRYSLGIFNGEGQNRPPSRDTANMVSGRASYAILGDYPDAEVLLQPLDKANLAIAAGAGFGNRNAARDWHAWSVGPAQSADVFNTTADIHFQADRFSSHLLGFFREVEPQDGASFYQGRGLNAQVGVLVFPQRLFGSLRYSFIEPNRDEDEGRRSEAMAGLQIFHFGHGSKILIEAGRGRVHNGVEWMGSDLFRTQYQLLF